MSGTRLLYFYFINDAGKNIYSYFRDGKWSVLNENLKKFKQVNNFTVVDTVVTTSIYQIMDIENIMMSLLLLSAVGVF